MIEPGEADLITLPDTFSSEGSVNHLLDATLVAGDVIQRSPVHFTDPGFAALTPRINAAVRWIVRAPFGFSGGGTLGNGGMLVAVPYPPGSVEIGLHLRLIAGEFVCGSPVRN